MYMKVKVIFSLVIAVLLIACNSQTDQGKGNGTTWGVGSFDSNGKRIYFTATSERGSAITYTGGPSTGMMMMGGNLTCASCHGTDARGGKHTMHMETMDAPDIRWSALSGEHHEEKTDTGEQHKHMAYNFVAFKNSVERGKHPDGDELKKDMPRWKMSDEDLRDLMDYLKSLQ
jgi:mono/diheme cytochrome c family protein